MTQYFIPATVEEEPGLAAFLLAYAVEKGYEPAVVLSLPSKGFLVPFDIEALGGLIDKSEVDFIPKVDPAPVMPDGPESVQRVPDVIVTEDDEGIYIQARQVEASIEADLPAELPYRERVRAWAKENGYPVGDRGAIKKEIVSYYELALGQAENKDFQKPAAE